MALDEFSTVLRAREFVRKANVTTIPVALTTYLEQARATARDDADMAADEAGMCMPMPSGDFRICVNANDRLERRRFTICHEIGHIVLGLKSDHRTQPWGAGRPLTERLCDLFAAELLLPERLFQPAAEDVPLGFAGIDQLAAQFSASVTTTGSRYADTVASLCAFVLSHQGKVAHAARSKPLRETYAVIRRHAALPTASVSARTRAGAVCGRERIDAEDWFSDWEHGGVLLEEAQHLTKWDQTLTLLWFEGGGVPFASQSVHRERRWEVEGRDIPYRREPESEDGLQELDGLLRFRSKARRK